MSEHHKTQKVKNIMNTASFHSSLSPPSSFGFPKACKKKKKKNASQRFRWMVIKGCVGWVTKDQKRSWSFQELLGRQDLSFWKRDVPSASRRESSAQVRSLAPGLHRRFSEAVSCSNSGGRLVFTLSPSQGLVVLPRPGITQIPLNTRLQMRTLEKKQ